MKGLKKIHWQISEFQFPKPYFQPFCSAIYRNQANTTFSVVVCLRCLLHHILSLIAYAFRKNGILFSLLLCSLWWVQILFVCLYITPSHYQQCANLSEDIELIKCLSDTFCRVCEWDCAYSLSYPLYDIWGCVFSVCQSPLWWLRWYILCHHQIGSMNYYPLLRARSWNNGMRCMSIFLLYYFWDSQHHCRNMSIFSGIKIIT